MGAKKVIETSGTPADPTARFALLELNGETYWLIFDFNAIARAEQVAKVNLLESLDFSGLTAAQYRGLFYASLLKAHPEVTIDEVGQLINLRSMAKISAALLQAWKNSTGVEDTEDPPEPERKTEQAAPAN